jgi:DNA repair protein RecO (recombination protein O)
MQRSTRTRAIVLRRTNYGEADRIVLVLTPEGQRSLLARGVRKEKSKLAGGIELFGVSDITVHTSAMSHLDILTSARLEVVFSTIVADYERLQAGYEAIKLVAAASHNIDDSGWFFILEQVLSCLNLRSVPLQLTQTWLYLQYAAQAGYEMNLERDSEGQQLQAGERYRYDDQERGLVRDPRGDITQDHIKYWRLMMAKPLAVVANIGGAQAILPDCLMVARRHASVAVL